MNGSDTTVNPSKRARIMSLISLLPIHTLRDPLNLVSLTCRFACRTEWETEMKGVWIEYGEWKTTCDSLPEDPYGPIFISLRFHLRVKDPPTERQNRKIGNGTSEKGKMDRQTIKKARRDVGNEWKYGSILDLFPSSVSTMPRSWNHPI